MKSNETKFYIDRFEENSFLNRTWFTADATVYKLPYPITSTEGEHSLESCENCKASHKKIRTEVKAKFEKFPNCCDYHKGLLNLKDFKKSDFKDIDKQVADKIMFTYHHIVNNIENENWYSDIVDYIEYAIESFGMMPKNCGAPFELIRLRDNLKTLLSEFEKDYKPKDIEVIDARIRINKIIQIIERPAIEETTDNYHLNTILNTYEQWYKLFPFELSYFQHLKPKFNAILPFSTGKRHYNKYSQSWVEEAHTKDSLTVELLTITQNLLKEINGLVLYENDALKDVDNIRLELIIKNRKIELEELSLKPNDDKADFIKILKSWLKGEKEFIHEIKDSLLPKANKKQINELRPDRTDIAFYAYYLSQVKDETFVSETFPSLKAWDELGKQFSKDPKNIQLKYNVINRSTTERLKPSHIKNIEYVANNMLTDRVKAKELALDELKLARLKK